MSAILVKVLQNDRLIGIVKLMSMSVHGKFETVNSELLTVNWRRSRLGFSLIELLIVVIILTIAASITTASYVIFERTARLKNGALQLKSDIRLVQNNALSGNKGPAGLCPATSVLIGWYLAVSLGGSSYTISGDCKTGVSETAFLTRTVNLPRGVTITNLTYGGTPTTVKILFRPLSYNVSFHDGLAPPFVDSLGDLTNTLAGSGPLKIELSEVQVSDKYQVVVQSSGEVNEIKI
ncbi:prepilin-type N-terminal cleavage/methylation domain-containing protein [Candidatus Curtissbacteria bacterium]|nr:prepilin-type N-terminal cleavage/methylation domain-containing protein [Candidatus Curtissbacteria bacterium]